MCPKCGKKFVWIEECGKRETLKIYRAACVCGWSKEMYEQIEIIPREEAERREWLAKKKGASVGGLNRKPRPVTFTCVVCGKENTVVTLGNPKSCPGECRHKLKILRAHPERRLK